jgi:hypothetical protein
MSNKVDRETAENEFERWAEAMDLDLDFDGMDENERRDTESDRRLVIRAIQNGSVIIDEEGALLYTPRKRQLDQPIKFSEPSGAALLVMDKKKKHAEIGKLYASLAELTKTSVLTFSKMHFADLKVVLAVYTLLMT